MKGLDKNLPGKFEAIRREMCARFVERDEEIRGLLAALISGEHVLLLGPVGTAKSMMALELCERVEGGTYFGWLLTKFSTPEELFGAISLRELENDRYVRVTRGKLPEAHIAFLDEIFKANSAILNSLLSLANERVFHNGETPTKVPLVSLIGASNELPEEGELMALYDRFLLRFTVDYIKEDFRFLKMLTMAPEQSARTTLSIEELKAAQRALEDVEMASGWLSDLVELRSRLNAKGIVASDRRYRKAVRLLKAYAVVDGRRRVEQKDMTRLSHVLWTDPSELEEVKLTLQEVFQGHEDKARNLLFQAREVRDYALRDWGNTEMAMRASIEAHTKLGRLQTQVKALVESAQQRQRRTSEVQEISDEIEAIQRQVLKEGM